MEEAVKPTLTAAQIMLAIIHFDKEGYVIVKQEEWDKLIRIKEGE